MKNITRDYVWRDLKGIFFRRKTGTAVTGAVTLRGVRTQITTEALTTAAAALYTLTITNNLITADSLVLATVKFGTATTGVPVITKITPAAGSVVIVVQNIDPSVAINGTLVIDALLIRNSPAQ